MRKIQPLLKPVGVFQTQGVARRGHWQPLPELARAHWHVQPFVLEGGKPMLQYKMNNQRSLVSSKPIYSFLLFWLAISACNLTEHPSLTRFITLVHTDDTRMRMTAWEGDYYRKLLINRVFEDQWRIVYNIPKKCSSKNKKEQLEEAMRQAIQQWLQPLIGIAKSPMVADFVFTALPAYENPEKKDERIFLKTDIEDINPHLQVAFYCEEGRSYAYPWSNEIHMFTKSRRIKYYLLIDGTNYSMTTLLHEFGHAFGLDDTYIEAYTEDYYGVEKDDTNISTGVLDATVGNQPFSVMAGHRYVADPDKHSLLTKDDVEGIRWLYRYFYENNTDIDTCHHADYELEIIDSAKNISGCRPSYPLIFEVKQKHVNTSLWLIRHAEGIDLNARDNTGNSALHYAAMHGICDVARSLLAKPIHRDITNNEGLTPLDYAEESGHERTAALLRGDKGARCREKAKTSACAIVGGNATHGTTGNTGLLLLFLPVLLGIVRTKHLRHQD